MSTQSTAFDESIARFGVFEALLKARSKYGAKTQIVHDADDRILTYNDLVKASFAIGSALKSRTSKGEAVGLMLPTSAASIISFFALNAYGRVPAMLNFTSGIANMRSALKTALVTKVVTARAFIEKAELGPLVEALSQDVEILYLEDIRENLSLKDKLAAVIGPIAPWLLRARPSYKTTGVILFTSGTEGAPKGVALSHSNLISNVHQILQHVPEVLTRDDILYNPLPTFHCFGLTGGALLPVLGGMKAALHPSPLHVKDIPRRIKETGSTLLFATDTFLNHYVRAGARDDFQGLRFAVCGAERVKDETRQLVSRRCDMQIIEGYGVTETSPVLAVNQPQRNRPGTVGRPLPGQTLELEPVSGINNAGKLLVKGPNIMLGYIFPDNPGKIVPPENGFHDTGDVVSIDEEGCITIRGRLKRFAKIGGEMVSLTVVENCAGALWPDHDHAAATLPDARKGEQIVLLTTNPDANRSDLSHWVVNHGVSELAIPRKLFHVEEIPLLGTGKMDIGAVQALAAQCITQGVAPEADNNPT